MGAVRAMAGRVSAAAAAGRCASALEQCEQPQQAPRVPGEQSLEAALSETQMSFVWAASGHWASGAAGAAAGPEGADSHREANA